jgi:hypothetical protein
MQIFCVIYYPRQSVGPSVGRSVGRSISTSTHLNLAVIRQSSGFGRLFGRSGRTKKSTWQFINTDSYQVDKFWLSVAQKRSCPNNSRTCENCRFGLFLSAAISWERRVRFSKLNVCRASQQYSIVLEILVTLKESKIIIHFVWQFRH